jgi:hypothetical protein
MNMRNRVTTCLLAVSVATMTPRLLAQDPPAGGGQDPAAQTQGGGRGQREPEIRPYDRVITRDAKSDDGVFTVHRIKDRVF